MGRSCILDCPPAAVRRPACRSRRFKGERPIGAATGQQSQPPRPYANPPPPPRVLEYTHPSRRATCCRDGGHREACAVPCAAACLNAPMGSPKPRVRRRRVRGHRDSTPASGAPPMTPLVECGISPLGLRGPRIPLRVGADRRRAARGARHAHGGGGCSPPPPPPPRQSVGPCGALRIGEARPQPQAPPTHPHVGVGPGSGMCLSIRGGGGSGGTPPPPPAAHTPSPKTETQENVLRGKMEF